jgi:hypothetical protein
MFFVPFVMIFVVFVVSLDGGVCVAANQPDNQA